MTRRAALGRGLDALLPPGEGLEESSGLTEVAPEVIQPNPRQPRSSFDPDALQELTASIAALGLLQPLLVRRGGGGGLELVAGERRLRAARAAGLARVPVMIVDTDDTGALERALVENVHRQDLDPIEEAAAYAQLLEEAGLTHEALAARLGRSRVAITNSLRLLDLPTGIKKLLVERRITAGHGRALLALAGNPFQERLAKRVAQEGLSVRELEELVRRYSAMTARGSATRATTSDDGPANEARRVLADHLQTRVRVERGKRKGRIVIDFVTDDELERLVDVIVGERPGAQTRVVSLD